MTIKRNENYQITAGNQKLSSSAVGSFLKACKLLKEKQKGL
jgi:hypothetical protein